jgi:hypothetical protein
MLIDGGPLPVGRDVRLQESPQVIPRIELRALLGQPDQFDPQPGRQRLALGRLMAGGPVQQEVDRPAPVTLTEQLQEGLKVPLTRPPPPEDHPMSGPGIDRTEAPTLRLRPGDPHLGLLAPMGPLAAQRGKPAQRRFLFEQDHGPGRDTPQAADKRPFFWARGGSFSAETERGLFQRSPNALIRRRKVRSMISQG